MHRILAVALLVPGMSFFLAADWAQFRGPDGAGYAPMAKLPTSFDIKEKKNIAWEVELPGRGPASPIVVGDRVFITASSGVRQDKLHVLAFDTKTGKQLWHRQFWATGRCFTHPSIGTAAPSPASDGKHIYAFYSSNDLACLTLDGDLVWYRGLAHDFPKTGNDIGMSSSPVLADNTVVVQVENQGDSFAAGIDTATGETKWRIKRDPQSNWVSPTVLPGKGKRKTVVLIQSLAGLQAYDPQTGDEVWTFKGATGGIASPVALGARVYFPSNGIVALSFGDQSAAPEVAWESNRIRPDGAGPAIFDNRIYALGGGVLTCADATDGSELWKARLPSKGAAPGQGRYWSLPVIAGGHLYCIDQSGLAHIVKLGDKEGTVVDTVEFGEQMQASPAIAGNAMYVRGDKRLWKIAAE